MTFVMVRRVQGKDAKIPSYDGGKLPMTTHLSYRVRQLLEERDDVAQASR